MRPDAVVHTCNTSTGQPKENLEFVASQSYTVRSFSKCQEKSGEDAIKALYSSISNMVWASNFPLLLILETKPLPPQQPSLSRMDPTEMQNSLNF